MDVYSLRYLYRREFAQLLLQLIDEQPVPQELLDDLREVAEDDVRGLREIIIALAKMVVDWQKDFSQIPDKFACGVTLLADVLAESTNNKYNPSPWDKRKEIAKAFRDDFFWRTVCSKQCRAFLRRLANTYKSPRRIINCDDFSQQNAMDEKTSVLIDVSLVEWEIALQEEAKIEASIFWQFLPRLWREVGLNADHLLYWAGFCAGQREDKPTRKWR